MKKLLSILLAVCTLCLCACSMPGMPTGESNEAVVTAMITAYQQANYEEFMKYICDDNELQYLVAGVANGDAGEMTEVYKKVHELTKNCEFTVKAVEGKEAWGEVEVTFKSVDVSSCFVSALDWAIQEDTKNGDATFSDMPGWIMEGFEEIEAESFEETFSVNVGCSEGNEKIDTNTCRDFFKALCGYYYDYIDVTLTTCTSKEDTYVLVSRGDEIIGMVETYLYAYEDGLTKENCVELLPSLTADYAMMDGIYAEAEAKDDAIHFRLGVDFLFASDVHLYNIGLIDSPSNAGHLSLASTINGFEKDGMTCETTDFGSGVLAEETETK